jgi:hypothetical protein
VSLQVLIVLSALQRLSAYRERFALRVTMSVYRELWSHGWRLHGRLELERNGHNLTSVLMNPREDMSELEVRLAH